MKPNPEDLKKTVEELTQKALKTVKGLVSKDFADKLLQQVKQFTTKEFADKAMGAAKNLAMQATESAKSAASAPPGGGGGGGVGSPRAMRFPYTYTAKVLQFPWAYYARNNWVYKYYFISIIVCLPIFKKISNVFNSPTNVKKWEAIKQKEREEDMHHHH